MQRPSIFADFHNADAQGRVRLNCVGTIRDLAEKRVALVDGLLLSVTDEDLEADGEAHFAEEEQCWVAVIDWQALRPHAHPEAREPVLPVGVPSAITSPSPVP